MKILRAEYLKCKRSMLNKLLFVVPFMTVVCSFFMGGVNNFQSITTYWWYSFILQGLIAVLCFLACQTEETSGNQLIIYSLAVNLKRVKYARQIVIAVKLLVAEMICMMLIQLCPMLLFPGYAVYSWGQLLLANVVIFIVSLWQIPFCFILMRFIGKFIAVFANIILGLLTVIALGDTGGWIINPYCWCAKEMEGILNIEMNGVFSEVPLPYTTVHLVALIFAVVLFLVLARADSYFYEKESDR